MSRLTDIRMGLILMLTALCVSAQDAPARKDGTSERPCKTIAIISTEPKLPPGLIEYYLLKRKDFRQSNLKVVATPEQADAVVHLDSNGDHDTSIFAWNQITGISKSDSSTWIDYPGMIALDVVQELASVCPDVIMFVRDDPSSDMTCAFADEKLRKIRTLSLCSHNAFMDDELHTALELSDASRSLPVQLVPACGGADAVLRVQEEKDSYGKWSWALRLGYGCTLRKGEVHTARSVDAANMIAQTVLEEIDGNISDSQVRSSRSSGKETDSETRVQKWKIKLVPSEVTMEETRAILSIGNGRVVIQDFNGKTTTSIWREQVKSARIRTVWNRPFGTDNPFNSPLPGVGDPTGVVNLVILLGYAVFTSTSAVLEQVHAPMKILDLTWEEDGQIKAESFQVPFRSGRLLRALLGSNAAAK